MRAAAEGDRAALDPLFHALWPPSVAYAARMLGGDHASAEDCTQEALVRLFGQIDRFDPSGDALTWTLTHVTWQCRTARRKLGRLLARGDVGAPDASPDGRTLAEERELVRLALGAIETLGPADVEVIYAALADDDALKNTVAPATFRKRLQRAHARLRGAWRARHGSI